MSRSPWPDVTVAIPSHDRHVQVRLAVDALARQDYLGPIRLVVVDDSSPPLSQSDVGPAELVSCPRGSPLGRKLNIASSLARTDVFVKADDDDWFGPGFVRKMVGALVRGADVAFVQPFRILDLATWSVCNADPDRCSGSGITTWVRHLTVSPFRDRRAQVDGHFFADALDAGCRFIDVDVGDDYLYVRNKAAPHLWNYLPDGEKVSEYIARLESAGLPPESLLPAEVVVALRQLGQSTSCS